MAWDIPSFAIPVNPDHSRELASWGDRLLGAYDQGQASRRQQDVLNARKALGEEMAANPTATPNYQTMAQRLLGNGDLEGAGTFMKLGQQETQNNFERQKIDIMRQRAGKAEQPTYGLNPVWGVDAQGNPTIIQLGKDGNPIQPKIPAGVTIAKDPIKIDVGTHYVFLDPQTRQPITTVQKNVAGTAAAQEVGKAAGGAQAQLPGAEGMAKQIGDHIDSLTDDKYLPYMLGPVASHMPNVSSDAARVQSKMDQLNGGAFLQARQMLKGGGAITDFEGRKAEQAIARLSAAQSVEDYKAALGEFKDALTTGLAKLRAQGAMVPGAGQNFGAPGGAQAPGASPAGGGQGWPAQSAAIPPAAASLLRSNPGLSADFDRKYGAGSASRVLGGQ